MALAERRPAVCQTAKPPGMYRFSGVHGALWQAELRHAASSRGCGSCSYLPKSRPGKPSVQVPVYPDLPKPALAGHVRAILLGGERCFFEAELSITDQAPNRALAGEDAARTKLNHQSPHRTSRAQATQVSNPDAVQKTEAADAPAAPPAHFQSADVFATISPHSQRLQKKLTHLTAGAARQNHRRHTFPQIIRLMSTYSMLTSNLIISLNRNFSRAGIRKRFR